MPTITKGDKVLVSGANGYIAMWVVRILLERGYYVRGTTRSADKCAYVEKYFADLGFGNSFQAVVVPDITADGAFDEAVKGVDGIAHTASPFHDRVEDPQEFFAPAIQGTVGMLKSALKNGTKVKRIVITSSCAAILSPSDKPMRFSEKDWNEVSPKDVEEKGKNAEPMSIYRASKSHAERSAWEWYEKHKTEVKWDISFINPPFVFGPLLQDITSLSSLNTSMQAWYNMVIKETPKTKAQMSGSSSWVDVRDTALGHILALEKEAAGNERIITSPGGYNWQEWLSIADSIQPSPLTSHKLLPGHPEILDEKPPYMVTYDNSKEQRILGIPYRTKEETTRDILECFKERGW